MFTSSLRCCLFLLNESLPFFTNYISLILAMHTSLSGVALLTYQIWSSKSELFVTAFNFNKICIYWKMSFPHILLNQNNRPLSSCSSPFLPPQRKTVQLIKSLIHSCAKLCNPKNLALSSSWTSSAEIKWNFICKEIFREVTTSPVVCCKTHTHHDLQSIQIKRSALAKRSVCKSHCTFNETSKSSLKTSHLTIICWN